MKLSETARIVAIFQALAPHVQPNKETVAVWHMALSDVPFEAALIAARVWVRERKHFPYPAELREIIAEKSLGLPKGDDVWRDVLDRVSLPPLDERRKKPFTIHPLASEALSSIGGVHAVSRSDRRDILRKEFLAAYDRSKREAVLTFDQSTAMDSLPTHEVPALNGAV